MVGRELLASCPHGEDHRRVRQRGEGENEICMRKENGKTGTDLKSLKTRVMRVNMSLWLQERS